MFKKILFVSLFVIMFLQLNITFSDSIGEIDMYVGERVDLDGYLITDNVLHADSNITWKLTDNSIVSIDSNGIVYAKEEGRVFANAIIKSGEKNISSSIIINVKSNLSGLEFADKLVSLSVGDTYTANYNIIAIDKNIKVLNKDIRMISSNSEIARVENGKIKAISNGEALIYGYTEDKNKIDKFRVKVSGELSSISFENIDKKSYFVGEKIKLRVLDDDDFNLLSGISFKSSNSKIASVDDTGNVTFLGAGKVRIDAKSYNDKKTAIVFDVKSMLEGIEVEENKLDFSRKGQIKNIEYRLIRSHEDLEPIIKGVTWSSLNSNIATVEDGVVKALASGITRITVKSNDGAFEGYVSVTVDLGDRKSYKNVEKVQASIYDSELIVGQERELDVNVYPLDASNKTLKISLDNASVARVYLRDDKYYILALKEGSTKVTFKSASEKESTIDVSVKSPLKGIDLETDLVLDKRSYTSYLGQEIVLYPKFIVKDDYDEGDVYEKKYTLIDKNGAFKIVKEESDEIIIVPLKTAYNPLKIVSKDGGYYKTLTFKVDELISEVEISESEEVIVGEEFTPKVSYILKSNIYDIDKPYSEDYSVRIIEEYISTDYIYSEIEYEKAMIKELNDRVRSDSDLYISLKNEISQRTKRKNTLESSIKYSKESYIRLVDGLKLTDRQGKKIDMISLSSNKISGNYRGYVIYEVVVDASIKSKPSRLYFSSQLGGLILKDKENTIISSSSEDALNEYKEVQKNKLIDDRFGEMLAKDIPSNEYIEKIMELEGKLKLDSQLKSNYKNELDYESALRIMINVFENLADREIRFSNYSYFKDDVTGVGGMAYNIGVISRTNTRLLEPNRTIGSKEFAHLFEKTINSVSKIKLDYKSKLESNSLYDGEILGIDEKLSLEKALIIINEIVK